MMPFISYRETVNDKLEYFILQKDFPHMIARISEYPIDKTLCCQSIAGYNLYLVFAGTLRGNMLPSYKDINAEVRMVFEMMALWFYNERILPDKKRYQKFKIKSDDNLPNE